MQNCRFWKSLEEELNSKLLVLEEALEEKPKEELNASCRFWKSFEEKLEELNEKLWVLEEVLKKKLEELNAKNCGFLGGNC
jgi:hypothetical protein